MKGLTKLSLPALLIGLVLGVMVSMNVGIKVSIPFMFLMMISLILILKGLMFNKKGQETLVYLKTACIILAICIVCMLIIFMTTLIIDLNQTYSISDSLPKEVTPQYISNLLGGLLTQSITL